MEFLSIMMIYPGLATMGIAIAVSLSRLQGNRRRHSRAESRPKTELQAGTRPMAARALTATAPDAAVVRDILTCTPA